VQQLLLTWRYATSEHFSKRHERELSPPSWLGPTGAVALRPGTRDPNAAASADGDTDGWGRFEPRSRTS